MTTLNLPVICMPASSHSSSVCGVAFPVQTVSLKSVDGYQCQEIETSRSGNSTKINYGCGKSSYSLIENMPAGEAGNVNFLLWSAPIGYVAPTQASLDLNDGTLKVVMVK